MFHHALSLITLYLIVGLNAAACIFVGVAVTGFGHPRAATRAAKRAAVGFFWPYLAVLLLRWVFFGGRFYERTVPLKASVNSHARVCTMTVPTPADLFTYTGWQFVVTAKNE